MGGSSRYDRDRPVGDEEAAEAHAYHVLAQVVAGKPALTVDRTVLGQISELLHMVGNELGAGRAVPRPVRRAVRGLAAALRDELDPRTGMAARAGVTARTGGAGRVGAGDTSGRPGSAGGRW